MGAWSIRNATVHDVDELIRLDAAAFPVSDGHSVAAAPGELESGVATGQTLVALDDSGAIVGYLQKHRIDRRSVYIAGLGVLPALQRQGVGRSLIAAAVDSIPAGSAVLASVELTNAPMIRLITQHGFVGSRYLPGYFGEGKDRVLFELLTDAPRVGQLQIDVVPVSCPQRVAELLDSGDWVIHSIVELPHATCVRMLRMAGDQPALLANEASVSVAFAGITLTAGTFLLGFGMVSDKIASDILLLLVLSVISSTVSLTVYANATGELSRLDAQAAGRYLQIGNILSEFGGVILLLQVLPVTLTSERRDGWVGLVSCLLGVCALILYQASGFDIMSRYTNDHPVITRIVEVVIAASPFVGYLLLTSTGSTVGWSAANAAALAAIAIWCLRVSREDHAQTVRHQGALSG